MLTYVASNYEQCEIFSATLLNGNPVVLGFDTETTVYREENNSHASIVQLCVCSETQSICYIFQLYKIFKESGKLPRDIIKILQNPNIIKVGADVTSDFIRLALYGITLQGSIDIQSIARSMLIPDISLEGLATKFVPDLAGKDTLKLKWNWDHHLNEKQIQYAAKDAYLSLQIYQKMLNGVNIITDLPTNEDPGEEEYLEWLKKMPKTYPIKIEKLVNQTINSYGPWAKRYTKIQRAEIARNLIQKFIEEGLL